ncbi:UNVERIFIED_CONTAM: hypothetical protein GTU68_066060 [Idotea baltica]|nr:hypothetical protein [Idotea baltica]
MDTATQELGKCTTPFQAEALKQQILDLNLSNLLLVDCTASAYIAELYPSLLRERISIVTPNKLAHAAGLERYKELKQLSAETGVKFYYEASVGAGLPVIGTLHDLLVSGDQVTEIEGILSGTLSYIFNSLNADTKYSEIIKDAHKQGLTEPDPREDLSGMDVARKLLILGRESGLPLELSDIQLDSLLPKGAENADSPEKLFSLLEGLDEQIASSVTEASEKNERLCYLAKLKIEDGSNTPKYQATIGLQSIPNDHPFYGLSGTDNIISFRTLRYEQYPLVVKGPGAGIEVTAAGVVADVLRVASYLG